MFRIFSSHGELTCDINGVILDVKIQGEPEDSVLSNITKIDIQEWMDYHEMVAMPKEYEYNIDILDVGYWYFDAESSMSFYEPPVTQHREIVKEDGGTALIVSQQFAQFLKGE